MQKSVTRVQITTKISEVKTKTAEGQPIYFEDRRRSCETFQRSPNTSKDRLNTSGDFRRLAEYFQSFPKIPEHFRRLATISGDQWIFFKLFQVSGRLKAIPSAYLRSKCMVRGFKLSFTSVQISSVYFAIS